MSFTITQLLQQDFSANQLNLTYDELLVQRMEAGWVVTDSADELREQFARHKAMLTDAHSLAVTLDWIQGQMTEAFRFLVADEGSKYVTNLYKVRLATDDLFVGSEYHDLEIGEKRGPDALVGLLEDVKTQVSREILGSITNTGTYDLGEARELMNDLFYFATCGLTGTKQSNLAYGNDVLVENDVYTHPTSLVDTGDCISVKDMALTVDVLNGML